jgi:hypothetical protein
MGPAGTVLEVLNRDGEWLWKLASGDHARAAVVRDVRHMRRERVGPLEKLEDPPLVHGKHGRFDADAVLKERGPGHPDCEEVRAEHDRRAARAEARAERMAWVVRCGREVRCDGRVGGLEAGVDARGHTSSEELRGAPAAASPARSTTTAVAGATPTSAAIATACASAVTAALRTASTLAAAAVVHVGSVRRSEGRGGREVDRWW